MQIGQNSFLGQIGATGYEPGWLEAVFGRDTGDIGHHFGTLLLPAISAGPPAGATREDWNRALSAARGESARRLVSALRSIEDLGAAEAAPRAFWPRYVEVLAGVGLLEGLSDRDPAGLAAWERALLSLRGAHESLGTWERPARGWRAHRRSLIDVLADVWAPLGRAGRGVEILTARDARGLEFRRQRLVGLVQGALTRPSPAAAILGDSERRTLNRAIGRAAFRTSADESLEGDLLLAERLRATGERIVVSWPVEDESATPLLPALEVERERERRGTPPPQPPAHAQPPAWRAVRRADVVTELMEIERERTRFFARPPAERRATAGRWSGAFDPATAGLLAEEVRGGRLAAWSASALETWSACAHRWFQGYLLGLRPPDERPLEAEPRTTGDLAHLALKRLFAEQGGATDFARVQAAVDAAADEVADARRGPPAVWATTRRRVAISLHRYLRAMAEEAKSSRVPAALEESFGREGSRTPGIELDTSLGRVSLRGTIDRLDRDPETGDLHVIDYKYSLKGREHTEAVDPERCGVERFQLYAYFLGALGWAEEMGLETGSVTGEIHCIRSAAVAGPLAMPDPLVVRAGIARAVEAAVGGVYDPTPRDAKRCRLCDFRRGCRISTVAGAFPEEDEGT